MKHIVNLVVSQPDHEFVSIRSRREQKTFMQEAASPEEAINRAARRVKSLGYMVHSATIQEQKTSTQSLAEGTVVPPTKKELPAHVKAAQKKYGNLPPSNSTPKTPATVNLNNAKQTALEQYLARKAMMSEQAEVEQIQEELKVSDGVKAWIDDFINSDDPKFDGKTKKERIQMALGAFYAAKRALEEQVELDEEKYSAGAEKLGKKLAELHANKEHGKAMELIAKARPEDLQYVERWNLGFSGPDHPLRQKIQAELDTRRVYEGVPPTFNVHHVDQKDPTKQGPVIGTHSHHMGFIPNKAGRDLGHTARKPGEGIPDKTRKGNIVAEEVELDEGLRDFAKKAVIAGTLATAAIGAHAKADAASGTPGFGPGVPKATLSIDRSGVGTQKATLSGVSKSGGGSSGSSSSSSGHADGWKSLHPDAKVAAARTAKYHDVKAKGGSTQQAWDAAHSINEEEAELDEGVSRKHFQQVADLIASNDDADKRKELAQHHAEIFSKQNPRFNKEKFFAAANVKLDEAAEVEQIDELSKATLDSYRDQAVSHKERLKNYIPKKADSIRQSKEIDTPAHLKHAEAGEKELSTAQRLLANRRKGIDRANEKLAEATKADPVQKAKEMLDQVEKGTYKGSSDKLRKALERAKSHNYDRGKGYTLEEDAEQLDETGEVKKRNKTYTKNIMASTGAKINAAMGPAKMNPADYGYKKAQHLNKAIGRMASRGATFAEEADQVEESSAMKYKMSSKLAGDRGNSKGGEITVPQSQKDEIAKIFAKKDDKKEVKEAAEGTTPTTAKEKELAAKAGDPNKITKKDVLVARGVKVDEGYYKDKATKEAEDKRLKVTNKAIAAAKKSKTISGGQTNDIDVEPKTGDQSSSLHIGGK